MSDVMRRYLSINRKGLCPKSCQLSSELSQVCLCFNLDLSALSRGLKSHQEDAGPPLEMALTFSFFVWGFQPGPKEQGELSGEQTACSGSMEVAQVTLCSCCQLGLSQTEPVLLSLCPAQPHLSHTGNLSLHYNQILAWKEQRFATSSRAAKKASERKCLKNSNGQLGLCEYETPALVHHKSDLYFHRIWAISHSPDLCVSILLSRDIQHDLSVLQ